MVYGHLLYTPGKIYPCTAMEPIRKVACGWLYLTFLCRSTSGPHRRGFYYSIFWNGEYLGWTTTYSLSLLEHYFVTLLGFLELLSFFCCIHFYPVWGWFRLREERVLVCGQVYSTFFRGEKKRECDPIQSCLSLPWFVGLTCIKVGPFLYFMSLSDYPAIRISVDPLLICHFIVVVSQSSYCFLWISLGNRLTVSAW